ncbi:MAG: RNase adapter RapZ [Christensenellales bacterium]|jgi:UPF0042 nucleotide-binding protein
MEVLLVTGLSGAGKTQVIRQLEDMGYFCVDNLPPKLLPDIVSIFSENANSTISLEISRIAVTIDIRVGDYLKNVEGVLQKVMEADDETRISVLFLDASDDVLIKRFKETRRKHPLEKNRSLLQAIALERIRLNPLKDIATYIVDTSSYTVKQLRHVLFKMLRDTEPEMAVTVAVTSFGFKHGIPADADIVFDVRFLPNPFYNEKMRDLTGIDCVVKDYIFSFEQTKVFLDKLEDMMTYLLPYYMQEDKRHLVIAIGCTGGQHRSVAISEELSRRLRQRSMNVYLEHRHISKR